jgi:transcriptional regulator with XRE-family HTH domain
MKPVTMEENGLKITEILRDIRREKKISQARLAKISGVHPNTVQRMEAGSSVSIDIFERLAEALGYELDLMPKDGSDA